MLYAIVFEAQQDQITEWCWGSCGGGLTGAIDLGECTAVPCRRESCPHLEKQMEEPFGDVNGESVILRKLLPVEARAKGEGEDRFLGHSPPSALEVAAQKIEARAKGE